MNSIPKIPKLNKGGVVTNPIHDFKFHNSDSVEIVIPLKDMPASRDKCISKMLERIKNYKTSGGDSGGKSITIRISN